MASSRKNTLLIVLLLGGFGALVFFRQGSGQCSLISFDPPATAPLATMPDWVMTDAAGEQRRASDFTDGPKLLAFWTTWCVNCRNQMRALASLEEELGPRGLSILGVNLDTDEAALEDYLAKRDVPFPLLRPTLETREAFGPIRAVPTTFLAAPDGTILARYEGAVPTNEVRQLLAPYLDRHAKGPQGTR
ncbi:MAG: TlpA family protein disulfide reductase [Opitutales bacterium]